MKILAIDPSINLLKLLSDNLGQYNYEFQGALDIELAYNVLQMGYQPEVIMVNLCFCVEPTVLKLEEFFRLVTYPYKAIVTILDDDTEDNRTYASLMGFHGAIAKPFHLKEVLTEIELIAGLNSGQFTFSTINTRRREVRLSMAVDVVLKIIDENTGQYFQEQTITEDISFSGASVLTLFQARVGSMINIALANETEFCIGIVRGNFVGKDRIRRLNLEIIGKRWQFFYNELTQKDTDKDTNKEEYVNVELLGVNVQEIFNNRYKIERELGKGGLGIVYQAFDLIKGEKVALKFLIDNQPIEERITNHQFFRREVKILSEIQHPNIVSILDSGFSNNGAPFFVMEYLEGDTLDKLLRKEKVWSIPRILNLLQQLCPALHAMHSKNIIHRDLKPGNIMIQKINDAEKIILLDLGIAKMVSGSKDNSLMKDITKTGTIVGTLGYISPEQCLEGEIDNGVDIYSLGIMVYQLLTGEMPFKGNTFAEVVLAHVQAKPLPLRQFNPKISAAIESVVLWAIAKNRNQRPKTIMDFLKQFEAVVQQDFLSNEGTNQNVGNDNPTLFIEARKPSLGASSTFLMSKAK
jgi:tRNA A-37 threonylcarbamoyl transferase component Bud32/DNA-binding response OmpR family regulator